LLLAGKMTELIIKIPDEIEKEMEKSQENWSKVAVDAIRLRLLRKKLESEEEKEITRWSVELGRRAKKESFKRLLSEISPDIRNRLLSKLSPVKRREVIE